MTPRNEMRIVADHPGNIVELTDGYSYWLQGPGGALHRYHDEASKRMAMLASLARMWPRPLRLKARLFDGRLALRDNRKNVYLLDAETPQAYRIALGRALAQIRTDNGQ